MRALIAITVLFCLSAAVFFNTMQVRYLFVAYLVVAAITIWSTLKWRHS